MERIRFKRPDLRQLSEIGYVVVDMHFHNKYSDALLSIDDLLRIDAGKPRNHMTQSINDLIFCHCSSAR